MSINCHTLMDVWCHTAARTLQTDEHSQYSGSINSWHSFPLTGTFQQKEDMLVDWKSRYMLTLANETITDSVCDTLSPNTLQLYNSLTVTPRRSPPAIQPVISLLTMKIYCIHWVPMMPEGLFFHRPLPQVSDTQTLMLSLEQDTGQDELIQISSVCSTTQIVCVRDIPIDSCGCSIDCTREACEVLTLKDKKTHALDLHRSQRHSPVAHVKGGELIPEVIYPIYRY